MTRIVYTSPHVPAEWIAAHGLAPCRLTASDGGGDGPVELREGRCSYMRAVVNRLCAEPEAGGLVLTTVCDQMRRAADLLRGRTRLPVFLFNVPATVLNPAAHALFRSELIRLGAFLERNGGSAPAPETLAATMRDWDGRRAGLRALRGSLKGGAFSAALAAFFRDGRLPASSGGGAEAGGERGVPLALVGGPLAEQDFALFDLMAAAGACVTLDGTQTGERMLPGPFDRQRLREDPLGELVDAYFGRLPDVFSRPNLALYEWLKRELPARGARGVVLVRHVWCDGWHAEVKRLQDWLTVPLLDLDLDGRLPSGRCATRISAFVETLA